MVSIHRFIPVFLCAGLVLGSGCGKEEKGSNAPGVAEILNKIHNPRPEVFNPIHMATTSVWVDFMTKAQQTLGYLPLTGTMDENGNYDRTTPSDHFVMRSANGGMLQVVFRKMTFVAGNDWRYDPFDIEFEMVAGEHRLYVHERRASSDDEASIYKGNWMLGEEAFEIDAAIQTGVHLDSDSTGTGADSQTKIVGSYKNARVQIAYNERSDFQYQSHRGKSVSFLRRNINSAGRTKDAMFVWQDVHLSNLFEDGFVSLENSNWAAHGSVTRNGQAWGRYRLEKGPIVHIFLDMPGESFRLQSWRRLAAQVACTRDVDCASDRCVNGRCAAQ